MTIIETIGKGNIPKYTDVKLMRLTCRIKEAFRFLSFAFYPKTTLIACVVFSFIVIVSLVFVMLTIPQKSNWYNVVFALTTGAVGSSIVSFVVELTSNYKHNKLAWYELKGYYSALLDFGTFKQILMGKSAPQLALKKAREEFLDAGGLDDPDEEEPKDEIQAIWEILPKLMPVLKETYKNKKEFLSDIEITHLNTILSCYEQISFVVRTNVSLSSLKYDALNHPDEDYLNYPAYVMKNMPDWIRHHISSNESLKAIDSLIDSILSDYYLLSEFMKDYDISKSTLYSYKDELELEDNVEQEVEEYDAVDEMDMDEETFKACNEAFYKKMSEKHRAFDNWHLSNCCLQIGESVDVLNKALKKKPFYGMMLRGYQKISVKDYVPKNIV